MAEDLNEIRRLVSGQSGNVLNSTVGGTSAPSAEQIEILRPHPSSEPPTLSISGPIGNSEQPPTGFSSIGRIVFVIVVGALLPVGAWLLLGGLMVLLSLGVVVAGIALCIAGFIAGLRGGFVAALVGGAIGGFLGFKLLPDMALAANVWIEGWRTVLATNMPQLALWSGIAAGILGVLKYAESSKGSSRVAQGPSVAVAQSIDIDPPRQVTPVRIRWVLLFVIGIGIALGWYFSGKSASTKLNVVAVPKGPVRLPSSMQQPISVVPTATEHTQPVDITEIVKEAVSSNRIGIEKVIDLAENGANPDIESAAKDAGRSFDFPVSKIKRDRKRARPWNDEAIALNVGGNAQQAYMVQKQAFAADPLDSEVAGNLAIFALRSGRTAEANEVVLYALSLPRQEGKTGRTADWATLAATYAELGEQRKARGSLFVTLAIAPDITKRCYSAVYSAKNTYTPALREATQAMFERIRDQGLSNAQECSLPISW